MCNFRTLVNLKLRLMSHGPGGCLSTLHPCSGEEEEEEDLHPCSGGEEDEEEDLFVFNDTIEGPRAPAMMMMSFICSTSKIRDRSQSNISHQPCHARESRKL